MILMMAWRNIWRNKPRSLVIAASVAIGLFAGLFVLAIYRGMIAGRIRIVIEDEVSHLQLHHPGFKQDNEAAYTIADSTIAAAIGKMPEVAAVSSRNRTPGMLSTGTGSNGVEIVGVDPAGEQVVSHLEKKIIAGGYFPGAKSHALLIGKKLCDKMKLKLNGKVVLTFTDRDNNVVSAAFRISGIFRSANAAIDERTVYVRAGELAALLNVPGEPHELAVLLHNDRDTDPVKQRLQRQYPSLRVESWKEISPETELTISTTNQFSLIIIAIIMLALAFGITNTMLMAILERTRETGMMLALGMSKPRLFTLVLCETIFLTLAGTPAGLLLAWAASRYSGSRGIDTASFAKDLMASFGYSTVIYPEFPSAQLAAVMAIVVITALASAVFPAVRVLRLRPVDALRK